MELDSDGVVAVSQTEVGFEVLWLFGRHFELMRTDRSWGPSLSLPVPVPVGPGVGPPCRDLLL